MLISNISYRKKITENLNIFERYSNKIYNFFSKNCDLLEPFSSPCDNFSYISFFSSKGAMHALSTLFSQLRSFQIISFQLFVQFFLHALHSIISSLFTCNEKTWNTLVKTCILIEFRQTKAFFLKWKPTSAHHSEVILKVQILAV